jgi:DNA-binding NarL/FixJ family response regulator
MAETAILLVDDHVMIRSALRALLTAEPALTVVGEASDGRQAITLTRELQPDVVVMDVGMPDLNGIDATRQAIAAKPGVKVVGLSARADERTARELLEAGAHAFVVKDEAYAELVAAIRAVVEGRVYLSPVISMQLSRGFRNQDASSPTAGRLTPREREVLQLIAEGVDQAVRRGTSHQCQDRGEPQAEYLREVERRQRRRANEIRDS